MRLLVTGIPGSGKSTLAERLATALGWRLLSKDAIKVALWDAFPPGDLAWSRQVGRAASAALHALVVASTEPVVVDHFVPSAFRDEWLLPGAVEVHCVCPPEVARRRYAERVRHPCHFDAEQLVDSFDGWVADDAVRAPLGPRLDVDTSGRPDINEIVDWLQRGNRQA